MRHCGITPSARARAAQKLTWNYSLCQKKRTCQPDEPAQFTGARARHLTAFHRYQRLIKQSPQGNDTGDSDFLDAGEARAAIVKVAVSCDQRYVAAIDEWGYVCLWDHSKIVRATAEGKNVGDHDAIVARWKINEGPILDIQFTKQNEKTCLLILLPPSISSTVNVPSFFAFEPPTTEEAGGTGELVASWQPHPSTMKDCMYFVDVHASPAPRCPTARESSTAEEQAESDLEDLGDMDDSLAANLAQHVNTTM